MCTSKNVTSISVLSITTVNKPPVHQFYTKRFYSWNLHLINVALCEICFDTKFCQSGFGVQVTYNMTLKALLLIHSKEVPSLTQEIPCMTPESPQYWYERYALSANWGSKLMHNCLNSCKCVFNFSRPMDAGFLSLWMNYKAINSDQSVGCWNDKGKYLVLYNLIFCVQIFLCFKFIILQLLAYMYINTGVYQYYVTNGFQWFWN